MRTLVVAYALLATSASASNLPERSALITPPQPAGPVCRDRIQTARAEANLPPAQPQTASPDNPLLIKAVDQRVGKCAVMVMHHDTSDIRPLPSAPQGPARLIPAR